MTSDRVQQVTIEDSAGKPHVYTIPLVGVDAGLSIMLRVYALAAGPAGEAVNGVMKGLDKLTDGDDLTMANLLDNPTVVSRLVEVVQGIDFGSVGRDLGEHLVSPRTDAKRLVLDILADVRRDGERLGDVGVMDQAYPGNWFELVKALGHAMVVNRFIPGLAGFSGAGQRPEKNALPTSGG